VRVILIWALVAIAVAVGAGFTARATAAQTSGRRPTTQSLPLPLPASALPPVDAALDARLRGIAQAAFDREPVGSLTVGVVRGGQLIWTASYGANVPPGAEPGKVAPRPAPADERTVYRIASVTKQFTALMLLQLVNEGVVHLSDPVSRYVPEIQQAQNATPSAAPVTLIQLVTHTSGLAVESDDAADYTQGSVAEWEATLLAALPRTRYTAEPGVRYAYSNVDYAILALALSRAARTPYVKYLHKHIFLPLGMTHTGFSTPPAPAVLAKGYVMQAGQPNGEVPERELLGRGYKAPAGGAFSTVGDLAKFEAFEMGIGPEAVLPKAVLAASRDLLVAGNARADGGYGVGFQVFPYEGHVLLGHLGGIAGYRSLAAFDPADKIGVIVLRNVSEGVIDPLALGKALVSATRLSPPPAPVPTQTRPPAGAAG
jgi:CubicO group peptidase (beta-lactamase class C family)